MALSPNEQAKTVVVKDLEALLKQTLGNDLVVKDYETKNFLAVGDNFASSIFKIIVKISKAKDLPIEELNLVGKTIITSITHFYWDILFKKEIFMYTDIIPLYESIERIIRPDSTISIAQCIPKLYGHRISLDSNAEGVDADAMILLEDLRIQGYYLLDKKIGLDMEHAAVAIKTLAKFHALGIVAKIKQPAKFERIKHQALRCGYLNNLSVEPEMIDPIRNSPRYSKYTHRVQQLAEKISNAERFELTRHEPWTTIVHYDYWTNNLMFHKNESGDIDGFKFIDFQGYTYADLFIDLPYFLCSSLNDDTMLNHIDALLDIYYEAFIETLKWNHIDTEQFERDKFDEQLRIDATIEFLRCNMAISFFTVEVTDGMSLEDLNDKIKNHKIKSDLYFRKLDNLFKIYLKKGWFYEQE